MTFKLFGTFSYFNNIVFFIFVKSLLQFFNCIMQHLKLHCSWHILLASRGVNFNIISALLQSVRRWSVNSCFVSMWYVYIRLYFIKPINTHITYILCAFSILVIKKRWMCRSDIKSEDLSSNFTFHPLVTEPITSSFAISTSRVAYIGHFAAWTLSYSLTVYMTINGDYL